MLWTGTILSPIVIFHCSWQDLELQVRPAAWCTCISQMNLIGFLHTSFGLVCYCRYTSIINNANCTRDEVHTNIFLLFYKSKIPQNTLTNKRCKS
jgi:hypothetical protein